MHYIIVKSVILFTLSSLNAGKNSSLGGASGNLGDKNDLHQEKADGGIHCKVTLWFKFSSPEKEAPSCFHSSFPSRPPVHPFHTPPQLIIWDLSKYISH